MSRHRKSDLADYQLLQEIGRGTFSVVYRAKRKSDQQIVALKEIRKQINAKDLLLVQNQIEILRNTQDPYVIRFYGDFKQNSRWYLVFQHCPNGDLNQLLKRKGKLQQQTVQMVVFCISSALDILHKNNIVHRDLKLANILINDNYEIKLADFGFSKNSDQQLMQTYCGTPITMAPQILQRKGYNENCDTWSLGIIAYQMIFGVPPFMPKQGNGVDDLANLVINKLLVFPTDIQTTQECKLFLEKCLIKNPSCRPMIAELLKDSWMLKGRQLLMEQKSIYKREFGNELDISPPSFSPQSSCEEKPQVRNQVVAAIGQAVEEHYQIVLSRLSMNNLKNVYKRSKEVLNQQSMELLPFLFLKKVRWLSQMSVKVQCLQKSFVVHLKDHQGYLRIKGIMLDFLKQAIPKELAQRQVNIEKTISLSLYDTLIQLILKPPAQLELKTKLESILYLIDLTGTMIGDGEVRLQVNESLSKQHSDDIVCYLLQMDTNDMHLILNSQNKETTGKDQTVKVFKSRHNHYSRRQSGSQFQELEFAKHMVQRRLLRLV